MRFALWKTNGEEARSTPRSARIAPALKDRRRSIFLWALLISAICGFINLGRPLEDYIQGARDMVRAQDYKGNVTVVAIDDASISALRGLNYSRHFDARLLDRLFEAGVDRVFYDRAHADPGEASADAAFVRALQRHEGKVFLGATRMLWAKANQAEEVRPLPQFAAHARLVSIRGREGPFNLSVKFPYRTNIIGARIPSMAAQMSGRFRDSDEEFRPDWSIRMRTVPTVSLIDVLKARVDPAALRGRDIVIGPTASIANDMHGVVSQGWYPGVYFHVVAAETLRIGVPRNWGYLPLWAVAAIASWLFLYASRRSVRNGAVLIASGVLVILPVLLDHYLISLPVFPAVLLLGVVVYRALTLRRVERSGQTNVISGLANLAALQASGARRDAAMIAMRLRNMAEIAASFDRNVEAEVVAEIRRRIDLSGVTDEIYHGEESLIWFSEIPLGPELEDHLEGLKAVLSSALPLRGREVDVSVAFGVDADFDRPITSRIGSAMLSAEEAAAANLVYKFYDPKRRDDASWQLSLLSRLDVGMNRGEVWLAYQPQLHLATNSVASAEALVRWTHPDRGLIGPDEFVALAEKHNRIERLTQFVLDEALAATARFNARGIDFSVAVNLPVQMLSMPHLYEMVAEALDRKQLSPQRLVLEVTETGRLDRRGSAMAMMEQLSAFGVGIAIDDYGTGNATLDYLKLVPATEVKIDRQFIAGMGPKGKDDILIASTIEMVHSLGRRVVAEGVETAEQLEALALLGCDVVQGYLVGRPLTEIDLYRIFDAGRRAASA